MREELEEKFRKARAKIQAKIQNEMKSEIRAKILTKFDSIIEDHMATFSVPCRNLKLDYFYV